uniref:Uncharacterized protein n=1 Tax=Chromera velia CCMP2878 TaxID=1169474 RepID=A0A0G4ICU4_9ALVE|eukprot:Cvel_13147.t1-p1 / transcript=Cvel_13147.t1 / gene=Cvel_13147 / organism=Chromera_velia_CCMP2878 / gene_product=hypothetical protein / transcript_product=hypothetical protein / location=Cvel_scaffold887:28982-31871(+) / protein_length=750 / sequence_SO=supercontig / SO=protein_coding / is_pseudo=false
MVFFLENSDNWQQVLSYKRSDEVGDAILAVVGADKSLQQKQEWFTKCAACMKDLAIDEETALICLHAMVVLDVFDPDLLHQLTERVETHFQSSLAAVNGPRHSFFQNFPGCGDPGFYRRFVISLPLAAKVKLILQDRHPTRNFFLRSPQSCDSPSTTRWANMQPINMEEWEAKSRRVRYSPESLHASKVMKFERPVGRDLHSLLVLQLREYLQIEGAQQKLSMRDLVTIASAFRDRSMQTEGGAQLLKVLCRHLLNRRPPEIVPFLLALSTGLRDPIGPSDPLETKTRAGLPSVNAEASDNREVRTLLRRTWALLGESAAMVCREGLTAMERARQEALPGVRLLRPCSFVLGRFEEKGGMESEGGYNFLDAPLHRVWVTIAAAFLRSPYAPPMPSRHMAAVSGDLLSEAAAFRSPTGEAPLSWEETGDFAEGLVASGIREVRALRALSACTAKLSDATSSSELAAVCLIAHALAHFRTGMEAEEAATVNLWRSFQRGVVGASVDAPVDPAMKLMALNAFTALGPPEALRAVFSDGGTFRDTLGPSSPDLKDVDLEMIGRYGMNPMKSAELAERKETGRRPPPSPIPAPAAVAAAPASVSRDASPPPHVQTLSGEVDVPPQSQTPEEPPISASPVPPVSSDSDFTVSASETETLKSSMETATEKEPEKGKTVETEESQQVDRAAGQAPEATLGEFVERQKTADLQSERARIVKMKKAQLRDELLLKGEQVPSNLTKAELQGRLLKVLGIET